MVASSPQVAPCALCDARSPVSQRGACAAALDAAADRESDPTRAARLRDDAYTARAHLRAADPSIRRLRRLLAKT